MRLTPISSLLTSGITLMTKPINELIADLEWYKLQYSLTQDEKRIAFLNQCIISTEAKIAKQTHDRYDTD